MHQYDATQLHVAGCLVGKTGSTQWYKTENSICKLKDKPIPLLYNKWSVDVKNHDSKSSKKCPKMLEIVKTLGTKLSNLH